MKKSRKLIANIIVIAFVFICISDYKTVYAEDKVSEDVNYTADEVSELNENDVITEAEDVKDILDETTEEITDEEIDVELEKTEEVLAEDDEDNDEELSKDEVVVTTEEVKEEEVVEESIETEAEDVKDILDETTEEITDEEIDVELEKTEEVLAEDDEDNDEELSKDEVVVTTEEVKEEEVVEESIETEAEVFNPNVIIDSVEIHGDLYDFKNYNESYIQVVFSEKIGAANVQITMVNKDDTSKKIEYTAFSATGNIYQLYANPSSISANGIYEIAKIDVTTFNISDTVNITYVNPKYKDVVSTEGVEFVEEYDFTGKTLEVINYESIIYSFEEFSVVENPTNGTEFGATVKIKSNMEITDMHMFLWCENHNVFLTSSYGFDEDGGTNNGSITRDGDVYTINLVPSLYAEGSTPLKNIRSGKYEVHCLDFTYNTQGDEPLSVNVTLADERFKDEIYYKDGTYDFSPLDITCTNPDEDAIGPVIDDIIVEKNNVVMDDDVTVKIMVSDNLTGFDEYADIYMKWTKVGDESFEYITVGSYNPESGCIEIRFQVTDDFEPGEYIISNIRIYDKCYNTTEYTLESDYDILKKSIFKVNDKNGSGSGNENPGESGSGEGGAESGDSGNGSGSGNGQGNGSNTNKPSVEVKPEAGNGNTTTGNNNVADGNGTNNNSVNTTTNGKGNTLPNTGDVVSSTFVLFLGISSILGGAFQYLRKKKK